MSNIKKITGCLLLPTSLTAFFMFLFLISLESKTYAGNGVIKEQQIVEINKSLKNAIEQNQELVQQNQALETELNRLKDESVSGQGKYIDLKRDRDGMAVELNRSRSANKTYAKQLDELAKSARMIPSGSGDGYHDFSSSDVIQLVLAEDEKPELTSADEEIVQQEGQTMNLLSKVDAFSETDERLRGDAARAHYNMGNIYYQKGEYEVAAREYYQAVTLMPDDPDAHYNLALVSSQNLRDYKTALKHFKMYLYLNPQAKDSDFIKEKIVEAELQLGGNINSRIDKEGQ